MLLLCVLMVLPSCGDSGPSGDSKPGVSDKAADAARVPNDGDSRNPNVIAVKDSSSNRYNATYIGRDKCITCHETQAHDWKGSYHDKAMEHATEATVVGDFNDVTFKHFENTSRLFKKDGKFFANTDGPDGKHRDFEIKYVFGVYPLQQYLVELEGGRLQALSITWDAKDKKWYHLYQDEAIPHTDILHWSKPLQNWNYMCASCHSTDLKKNYDPKTDKYNTTWFEMNVSCEACHGPGSAHVDWANTEAEGVKGGMYYGGDTDYRLTNPMKGREAYRQTETCAPCHARRQEVFPGFQAGNRFYDHYTVQPILDQLYFPDGQIKDEVYVHGSFVQSKMYHKNVVCSNCHNPHSTKIYVPGNQLCVRCHDASKFDTATHHHHPLESKGALCIECHMPKRTYMVVDDRRDHSFSMPRPDLSIKLGVPNACNQCHQDKDAKWANDAVVKWWGPKRHTDPHFAATFAAARNNEPAAEAGLIALTKNKERPATIRATAVTELSRYGSRSAMEAGIASLKDSHPMVRAAALRKVSQLPQQNRTMLVQLITPLLHDEFRYVRVEAARLLVPVANQIFADRSQRDSKAFWLALEDYKKGQSYLTDRAGTHLNLAVMWDGLGKTDKAIKAYQKAIEMEGHFVPARMNLAMLYARLNRTSDAEEQLAAALRAQPSNAQVHYSMGLLMAENKARIGQAVFHLGRAAVLEPNNPRMQYNYGLALQRIQKYAVAAPVLNRAHQLEPRSPDYLNALIALYSQQSQWSQAASYAQKLVNLFPSNPQFANQLRQLQIRASQSN
jgi:predicted CXXCH cytochrome family protein